MITRSVPDGLLCFRQMDHAALSGELAARWGGAAPALMPAESVLFAIGNHDSGWPDLDDRPRLDLDRHAPFTYRTHPLSDALGVAERSVARVAAADPYAAWLVSRHFASFYADDEDPRAAEWVGEQVGLRAELLARARSRVPRETLHPFVLEANFDWLQLLDALSLAACHDWSSWQSRSLALEYGEATGTYQYRQTATGRARQDFFVEGRVDPWPFEAERIKARIPARLLPDIEWETEEQLLADWQVAPLVGVEVVLRRG